MACNCLYSLLLINLDKYDENVIKKHRRQLQLALHPDKNPSIQAASASKMVNLAFATLHPITNHTMYLSQEYEDSLGVHDCEEARAAILYMSRNVEYFRTQQALLDADEDDSDTDIENIDPCGVDSEPEVSICTTPSGKDNRHRRTSAKSSLKSKFGEYRVQVKCIHEHTTRRNQLKFLVQWLPYDCETWETYEFLIQ